MKIFLLLAALFSLNVNAAKYFDDVRVTDSVLVGSITTTATNAAIEILSTTGGLLLPRMTTAERDALGAGAGMLVFNTDTQELNAFGSSSWGALAPGAVNPLTTTGDIYYRTATVTAERLPVGSAGQVLQVSASSGLPVWDDSTSFVSPFTATGDTLARTATVTEAAIPIGSPNQVYTVHPTAGIPIWEDLPADVGFASPFTATGDMLIRTATVTEASLTIGSPGQILTVHPTAGIPIWEDNAGFVNPMTLAGSMIIRTATEAITELQPGSNNQVLTINPSSGIPAWITPSAGFADPMTTRGDIIFRDATNTTARLGIGANGEVLKSDGTDLAYAPDVGFNSPFTATGDILIRTATVTEENLPIGSAGQVLTVHPTAGIPYWENVPSGFADPMTTRGDIIYRDATNTTARLAVGGAGTVLSSDGTDASWAAPVRGASPLTTTGDLIVRTATVAEERLPIGSAGQVLTVHPSSGLPIWESLPVSAATLQDAYDNSSVEPEITLDSTRLGLSIWDNAVPTAASLFDVRTGAGVPLFAVDTSSITLAVEANAEAAIRGAEIATPANPPVGYNKLYFKADGNLYKLDDTGSESQIAGGSLTQTNFSAANNQTVAANVTGMTTTGHNAVYFIVNIDLDATVDQAALCEIKAMDIGGSWILNQECAGSPGINVVFSISGTQVQYTSDNYAGFVSLDIKWQEIVIN